MELIVASSSVDSAIGSWDLRSGSEQPATAPPPPLPTASSPPPAASSPSPSSASPPTPPRLISSSGLGTSPNLESAVFRRSPSALSSRSPWGLHHWWGGSSGAIYLWEVAAGELLNKWHAHYRSVTCLMLSDDESLLISGSEDGCVRVWSLLMMFDDIGKEAARNLYRFSFSEHTLRVTDVVCGHGLCNSLIISSSEDCACKIWSLSEGRLLRNIVFPSIIDAIAMDPGEHAFYAGGRDGKIYIQH